MKEEKPRWKKSESGHALQREPESVQQKVKRQMHKQKQQAQKSQRKGQASRQKKPESMSALEQAFAKALNK